MIRVAAVVLVPAALLAFAAPFWDAKPPADWTLDEVQRLLTDSPWAQRVEAGPKSPAPPVQIYLASADPVIQAEDRLRAARKQRSDDPSWDEYREYLLAGTGKYIVVAIAVESEQAFSNNSETQAMEEESRLRIGKRTYKVAGHFPPSTNDRWVRLVFPREVRPEDRLLRFELYVPGTASPYRQADFRLKDLVYRGQPNY